MNYRRSLVAASFLAVITSQACTPVVAFSPLEASPVGTDEAKTSRCSLELSTDVKEFPHATVAKVMVTGPCDPLDTTWALTSNPDGVVYRIYPTHAALLADQPSTDGRGKYLRVIDFIHTNPVCVEASTQSATARIGLLGTSCTER